MKIIQEVTEAGKENLWAKSRLKSGTNLGFDIASSVKNRHVRAMNTRTIISSKRHCYIELLNFDMDPNVWFVRKFKKSLVLKKQVSSDRFIDEMQARRFAEKMKRECGGK